MQIMNEYATSNMKCAYIVLVYIYMYSWHKYITIAAPPPPILLLLRICTVCIAKTCYYYYLLQFLTHHPIQDRFTHRIGWDPAGDPQAVNRNRVTC